MLIEAFCRYKIETKHSKNNISSLKFLDFDSPITEDMQIISSGQIIPFFGDKILVSQSDNQFSRVFEINFKFEVKISHEPDPKSNFMSGSEIKSFESIYPCTDILIFLHGDQIELIKFIFEVEKRKDQIIKSLKKIKPSISNGFDSKNNIKSTYIIEAIDGNIEVDLEALKRENLVDLYFNENKDVSRIINTQNQSCFENVDYPNLNINSTDKTIDKIMKDLKINDKYEKIIQKSIFEYSNDKSYLFLIKSFINELDFTGKSFMKHWILDSLYFIFIKIKDHLTVIVSNKLYNFIPLHNVSLFFHSKSILMIPDLNQNNGNFKLICSYLHSNQNNLAFEQFPDYNRYDLNLNYKYKIPEFNCEKQIELLFKYSYIMLEESQRTFWLIAKIHEILFPMRFPGLILSPIIKNMEYLLDGPYPFLISSNKVIELKDRPIFSCETPDWEVKIEPTKTKKSKKWTGKLRVILNAKKKELSFIHKKQKYIKDILLNKKIKDEIPHSFNGSNLIEKCFLNEPRHIPVNYSYDINKYRLIFHSYNRMNITDAISLWLIIYNGKIDLLKLFNKKWIDYEFLCMRACIDNNIDLIKRIFNKARSINKPGYKSGIQSLARRRVLNLDRKPFNTSFFRVLQSFGRFNKLYEIDLDDLDSYSLNIKTNVRKYSTEFIFMNESFKLLKIEQIIACLRCGYVDNQVKGSIISYFKYYDLPLKTTNNENEIFDGGMRIFI